MDVAVWALNNSVVADGLHSCDVMKTAIYARNTLSKMTITESFCTHCHEPRATRYVRSIVMCLSGHLWCWSSWMV